MKFLSFLPRFNLATFLFMLFAFTLTACATVPTPSPFDPTPAYGQNTLADEKALIGLEASAIAINYSVEAAVDSGLLAAGSPEAVRVADLLVHVRSGVLSARTAHRAGNSPDASIRLYATLDLIGQINALIVRKPPS